MDFGINFNTDMDFEEIKNLANLAEKVNFSYLWIGDNINFPHSFPLLPLVASSTEKAKIGHGIISPFYNRCMHIKKAYETLREYYGERFVVGLSYGDLSALRRIGMRKPKYEKLEKCAFELRESRMQVFIGASGPKTIEKASRNFGLLLNYATPEYLKWAMRFLTKKTYLASYAPAMLFDFKNLSEKRRKKIRRYLLLSCATVLAGANKAFLEEFGLKDIAAAIRKALSEKRHEDIKSYEKILLENFSISGSIEEVIEKCKEIRSIGIDQIIFATPFAYNKRAIEKAGGLINALS